MRKYIDESKNELAEVICNKCGKKINVKNGIIIEGNFSIEYNWGYFSDKDGERHIIDLCEKCYDKFILEFKIPVTIEDNNELI